MYINTINLSIYYYHNALCMQTRFMLLLILIIFQNKKNYFSDLRIHLKYFKTT